MHWPLWCKICYHPRLEQKHKADYSFQSQVRKSGVTRVRKSGVRKSRVTKWRHPLYCVKDIKSWVTRNMLMLNDSKIEILHLYSRHISHSPISSLQIGNSDVDLTSSAKNLGVVLDNSMPMSQHVTSICESASFALHKIVSYGDFLISHRPRNSPSLFSSYFALSYIVTSNWQFRRRLNIIGQESRSCPRQQYANVSTCHQHMRKRIICTPQNCKLWIFLVQPSTEKLVHAFITSWLDNCNSVLFDLPACELDKLQRIKNAAARLVLRIKGHFHMKPVLRQLHWLPVRKRIMFKIILNFSSLSKLSTVVLQSTLLRISSLFVLHLVRSDRHQQYYWNRHLQGWSRLRHMEIERSPSLLLFCGINYQHIIICNIQSVNLFKISSENAPFKIARRIMSSLRDSCWWLSASLRVVHLFDSSLLCHCGYMISTCACSLHCKKTRNFTDPVMGNCDKKSTGNRKFTGKCPYILYINGQFTVLLQIFCKFTGNWPYFTGFTVCFPENLLPGNAPFFQITGHFPAAIFRGIYRKSREIRSTAREFTENLQKNRKLALSRKFTIPRTFLIAITHYGVRKITVIFYSVYICQRDSNLNLQC